MRPDASDLNQTNLVWVWQIKYKNLNQPNPCTPGIYSIIHKDYKNFFFKFNYPFNFYSFQIYLF